MNKLEKEDIQIVAESKCNWDKLTNKIILVSGGTGFLGSFFCDVIRYRNNKYKQKIKVISLSLHPKKSDDTVTYIKKDITEPIKISKRIDYIIHLASNTHPTQYETDPVGTITKNIFGSYNLLTLAKEKKIKRFVLASSCEIYGNGDKKAMDENYCGYINCNTVRAGYNESKRLSESLCQSFNKQYSIDFVTFRLARVFGPDKTKMDSKVMSQFIRNAINNQNVILKSDGKQKYSYIYVADAVQGIFFVLLNGTSKEAYNIAAEPDNCTLKDYAGYIASLSNKEVILDIKNNPFASSATNSVLKISKIKKIGFRNKFKIKEAIKRTFEILKESK